MFVVIGNMQCFDIPKIIFVWLHFVLPIRTSIVVYLLYHFFYSNLL